MKPWFLALVLGRRPQLVTQTFTANGVLVVPASVNAVNATGNGARGTNAQSGTSFYYEVQTTYGVRRSDGVGVLVFTRDPELKVGQSPASGYCSTPNPSPYDPVYSAYYLCYGYERQTTTPDQPATRGASATGVGKTFPGSLGNVAQTPTVFTNVAVTPGASYNIVVPTGGSVTISYYV